MLAFEDDERLDLGEDLLEYRPARDHEITHTGASVADVTGIDHPLDVLQTRSCRCALRKRHTCSDVEPELVLPLPDELEMNTSISVEESCEIACLFRLQCVGL